MHLCGVLLCARVSVATPARPPAGYAARAASVVPTSAVSHAAALVVCSRLTCTANDTWTRVGTVMALDTNGQSLSLSLSL